MNTLYKFGAVWCSPCKALDPLLEEHFNNVNIIKIDIEEEPEKAMAFGIRSVPTLVLTDKQGKLIAMRVGGINRQQLRDFVNQ